MRVTDLPKQCPHCQAGRRKFGESMQRGTRTGEWWVMFTCATMWYSRVYDKRTDRGSICYEREIAALKDQLRWRQWPEEKPEGLSETYEIAFRSPHFNGFGTRWALWFVQGWTSLDNLPLAPAVVTHWRPLGRPPEEGE